MSGVAFPYASECAACGDLLSDHRSRPGSQIDGRYYCLRCPCDVDLNAPSVGLSKARFVARYPKRPAP